MSIRFTDRVSVGKMKETREGYLVSTSLVARTGVFWAERYGKWEAQIAVHGKSIALGRFSDIGDAATAYRNAAERLHGEFARHSLGLYQ